MTTTTVNQTSQTHNGSIGSDDATTGPAALSSPIVAALEGAWAAIQDRHPEIPDVVIVLASGSVGAPRGALKLGHFAAMRWSLARQATGPAETGPAPVLPEVFVGGEGLGRGAVDVLGTLLHEATHALAHVRGIKDTSRQGRYHSRKFRDLAEELGLEVREVPVIGWSDTHVPDATRTGYAPTLDALTAALTLHRRAEGSLVIPPGDGHDSKDGEQPGTTGGGTASGTGSRNGAAARCHCGRRIRVSASVLALGPITCGICGQPFTTNDAAESASTPNGEGEGDEEGDA